MPLGTERTTFSLDIAGRYTCNTWQEAMDSTDASKNAGARPFDTIVIGGGTFGAVFASHLFNRDKKHAHRTLVLEAGPMALPEHVQNLPMLNTNELWGTPWNSDSPQPWNRNFPGLAFAVGGRSLFWGGWSPYFIDSELPPSQWPAAVITDLTTPVIHFPDGTQASYLDDAARQIGTDSTNDFVQGKTHEALRDRLFNGIKNRPADPVTNLTGNRGGLASVIDLEAPLAVQSSSPRPGFFPINKFSGTPLLIRAARQAQDESAGDDSRKRLMVVDNTHVIRLERIGNRITRLVTNHGTIDVPDGGRIVLALGTIENTRMALNTLPNANGLIGRNLMAHLRSNLTIRVPRASFGSILDPTVHPDLKELQVSALFVKGIHTFARDGSLGHFHIQITASGVGETGMDSEAELFKKVPDIDGLDQFRGLTDQWIVLTLRGIGEMIGDKTSPDPLNRITLDRLGPQGPFDFGTPRALVRLEAGPTGSKNLELWDAIDNASKELALMFAGGDPNSIQYLSSQSSGVWQSSPPGPESLRDTLSSTHHEGGTCWMGTDQAASVTDDLGRFHECANLHAVGPCLLPTLGSPNPMLSGVALARRAVDYLVPLPVPDPIEAGFEALFDGTDKSLKAWQMVGGGSFALIDGLLVAEPSGDIGLLYYTRKAFGDFTLRLQFKLESVGDNSGVFVRSRNPLRRVPDRTDPNVSYIYDNKAFVAVDTGFEVQIDEMARGNAQQGQPDGLDMHRTGAIYNIPVGPAPGQQTYRRGPFLQAGVWNDLEIEVVGDTYTVRLKQGQESQYQQTTSFTNTDSFRGKAPAQDANSGFIGLQTHTGRVAFRHIRITPGIAVPPSQTMQFSQAIVQTTIVQPTQTAGTPVISRT